MVDRIIKLPGRAEKTIRDKGYAWFLDGDNDEYLTDDAILISQAETDKLVAASEACFVLYEKALDHISKNDLWSRLGLPSEIIPLIHHDMKRNLPHIIGRLDFAGGIEQMSTKLIEFNADTNTIMPESALFQSWMFEPVKKDYKGQMNYLHKDLVQTFIDLKQQFPDRPATLLLSSLGHVEDRLNLNVIYKAAVEAGFEVEYSDLEKVVFGEDGVFLHATEGYKQYFFFFKLIPWEFIMFEEPDLMKILVDLSINHDLIVLNPSYSIVFQAKHIMSIMYEMFPENEFLLPTYDSKNFLKGKQYVRKGNFGRLGENIKIVDPSGETIAKTKGDFGEFTKIFQEFAEMYADEDGDIYQPSMFLVDGRASCISFRRRDDLIIDDDAEFVPHVIF